MTGITFLSLYTQLGPDATNDYINYNFSLLTGATGGSGSVSAITASNGIGISGTNITLGGSLSALTTISTSDTSYLSIPNIYSSFFSAGTYYSGSTPLTQIFALTSSTGFGTVTSVNATGNLFTGGTSGNPIIFISNSPSFDSETGSGTSVWHAFSSTTFSADTINSGTTNLYSIFQSNGVGVQSVGSTGNITTGGTFTNPTISISDSPVFNNITASGNTIISTIESPFSSLTVYGTVNILGDVNVTGTASTFNTQTIQTESNTIHLNLSGTHISATYGGVQITSGQTSGSPSTWTIDVSGNWSANTQIIAGNGINSIGSIQSGGTDLYRIFSTTAITSNLIQSVSATGNLFTGGTQINPIIELSPSPSFINETGSGTSIWNAFSSTTFSAGTINSGTTSLYQIFMQGTGIGVQNVVPGTNITTGGTQISPIISIIPSPVFTNLTVSGIGIFSIMTALTIGSSGMANTGGTTNIVTASSGGTMTASTIVVNAYNIPSSAQTLLSTNSNWSGLTFIASGLTGTYQGQRYYDSTYFYEAVADNSFVRLVRA